MHKSVVAQVAVIVLGMALAGSADAQHRGTVPQQHSLNRKILQTFDVPGGRYQTMIGISGIGPNQRSGRQSHPGPEGGYVLQGSGTIMVDGQPPLSLEAGQSYQLAPGAVHDVRGGAHGVKLIVTWVVPKGRPFILPAN